MLAKNPEEAGLIVKNPLYSIVIDRGQLVEAKRYVDARQIFNQKNFINLARARVDSAEAFQIARDSLGPAGQKMVSASYQRGFLGRPVAVRRKDMFQFQGYIPRGLQANRQ